MPAATEKVVEDNARPFPALYVVFVSVGVCHEHVPSPSSLKNFEPPDSPVDFNSVPSKSHDMVKS